MQRVFSDYHKQKLNAQEHAELVALETGLSLAFTTQQLIIILERSIATTERLKEN